MIGKPSPTPNCPAIPAASMLRPPGCLSRFDPRSLLEPSAAWLVVESFSPKFLRSLSIKDAPASAFSLVGFWNSMGLFNGSPSATREWGRAVESALSPLVPASAALPLVPASAPLAPLVPASAALAPLVPASAALPLVPASAALAPLVPASAALPLVSSLCLPKWNVLLAYYTLNFLLVFRYKIVYFFLIFIFIIK